MIKNDAQRGRARARLEAFREALATVESWEAGEQRAAARESYEGVIRELEAALCEYEELRAGKLAVPPVERLGDIAPWIVKIRIAKGVSQKELAQRLGISKQVVSRYEENDYQTVGVGRLEEILEAMGVK